MEKEILKGKLVRNDKAIMKYYRCFLISAFIGLFIILCSIIIGIITNPSFFGKESLNHHKVTIVVNGVHEQDDTVNSGSGDVVSHMYHLLGKYDNKDIVLIEAYPEEDMALSHLKEERVIHIDTNKMIEIVPQSINYLFIVFLIIGFMVLIVSFLGVYRYSTEYKLLKITKK